MRTVILAGGLGTRLAEETETRPKPMVEIGGRPILWHIMKHYAAHWFNEFVVALGYKGEVIKRYFLDYSGLTGSLSVNLARGEVDPARAARRGLDGSPRRHRPGHEHRRPRQARVPTGFAAAPSCSPTATASATSNLRAARASTARTASWRR